MGRSVSFFRIDGNDLQKYSRNPECLTNEVFNPDFKNQKVVVDIDKSLEGILFLLTGQSVDSAEAALVNVWNFKPLIEDAENGTAYYLDRANVHKLNLELSQIDMAGFKERYDPKKLNENKIYPDIWDESQGI